MALRREAEVHQDFSRPMLETPQGVCVPNMLLETRTKMTTSNIANVKQSIVRPSAYVDALQPPSAVMAAGAIIFSGFEKSIVIPCQTGAVSKQSLSTVHLLLKSKTKTSVLNLPRTSWHS